MEELFPDPFNPKRSCPKVGTEAQARHRQSTVEGTGSDSNLMVSPGEDSLT